MGNWILQISTGFPFAMGNLEKSGKITHEILEKSRNFRQMLLISS